MITLPLVSVIIPAYNAAKYIAEALASASNQTYQALEIIVVDDGSTDDTVAIVERSARADDRIHLVRQPNAGVAAARNSAIAAAQGVYIAPLDADDMWAPTKIERQVRRMEEGGERVGLVYCWWDIVDEDGAVIARSHPWRAEGDLRLVHVALNFIGNASVPLIRRTCFTEIGLYEPAFRTAGGEGCEDWDLTLRIAERFDMCVEPAHLVRYRRVRGSMSGQFGAMIRSHSMMLEKAVARRQHLPRRLVRWSRGLMYGYLVMIAVRAGDVRRALAWTVRGVVAPGVSYWSPWALELLLAKLPPPASETLIRRLWTHYPLPEVLTQTVSLPPPLEREDHSDARE